MTVPSLSFRARVLAVVVAVGVMPLLLLGLWLTGQTARSGEALLRERLDAALVEGAEAVERRWIPYRSALLDLVEDEVVRDALHGTPTADAATVGRGTEPPEALASAVVALDGAIAFVTIRDSMDREAWSFDRSGPGADGLFGRPLTFRLPFHAWDGRRLGTVEAGIRFPALRGSASEAVVAGGMLTALDARTGAVLLPVPFDPTLVGRERFRWNDRDWIGRSREVVEPRATLVAAAPVAPFMGPFEAAARRGLWILSAVAGLGLVATWVLTGRLTAHLERLAESARAVAAGDLDRTVEVGGDDEVGQVARAFATMVESLRRTLRQLAERESLAAVNEFAASLAHEIRNPLTSVQLDLQQVEEELQPGSPLRILQGEAIDELRRLDRTVAGALETARSGRVAPRAMDLREPLRAATRRALPAVEERGARLSPAGVGAPVPVPGDRDALEQVFLNLLLNAAAAVEAGGEVSLSVSVDEAEATVTVRDDGRGIPEEERERIFEPFFTTRPGGTGLGLAVARRIVAAHGGTIRVRSAPGEGTAVEVRLPREESAPRESPAPARRA